MKALNVVSLFDGISCGMLALDRAGIPVDAYFASEIDENAIAISQKNHHNIIRLGDVTRWREWDIPWADIDLIIGGSPCQGFSRAGKCLNFNDPRSKLFFVFVDILNHIRTVNPGVLFLLENVKMKTEWRDIISEHLGVQPIEINSYLLSAQNRLRTYWTNIPGVKQPQDKGIKLADILEAQEIEYITAPDGMKFDPTISEQSRALVNRIGDEVRVSQTTKIGYILAEDGDGINLSFPTSKSRRGRVIKQKSSTVDCACNICVFRDGAIRRFTIRELERLQTLPDGYTDGFGKGIAQKAIGNGWTVDVIAHIFGGLKGSEKKKEEIMKIMLDEGAIMPTRAHPWDAGLDLYAKEDGILRPCDNLLCDTGVHIQIPEGFTGLIRSRSGLMVNHHIVTDGTIDSHYTGSIRVKLFNLNRSQYRIYAGDKIAQIVIVPCAFPELEIVDHLEETDRGDGGFGSTGR